MSTENKSLKFIHLSSTTSAQHSDANVGAIIFEPKSGRIAVDGAKGLEYYGGGRVSDAKFENSILTISFNNGDKDIVLDFTDTASASGVDKILGKLRYDVDALETTVNGDGSDGSGLVNKVAANATAIQANADAIDAINASGTGILDTAKTYTDGKITELRGGADGYKGTLKDLDGRIASNDTDILNLRALHADGTGETAVNGKMRVIDEINAKVGDIKINDTAVTVKDYVDGKVTDINATTGGLRTDVDNLKTAVGSSTSGLVKDVADLKGLHAAGDHNGKATVAEEVAAGIAKVVANAPADFDTLKEIADWITNDTIGATQMANDIKDLKAKVGASTDSAAADGSVYARIKKNATDIKANADNIKTNADAIADLKKLHVNGKSVAQEVTDGIAAIGQVTKTNDDKETKTADVVVTVTTAAGSVQTVAVDAKVLADKVKANADAIDAEETRATDAEAAIRADLGEKTAVAGTDTAFARIAALEKKQTDGALMWSSWAD